jgi:hypothetical protein
MILKGQVGAPPNQSATDGNNYPFLQGKAAEMVVAELHGKYYTQAYRGNVFVGTTVQAGLAIPLNTTTAPLVMLWNPASSGKNLIPIKFRCGYVSGATVSGTIGYNILLGAGGGSINTVVTAFVPTTAPAIGQSLNNGFVGAGNRSAMQVSFSGTNTIVTTNSFYLRNTPFSYGAPITSSTVSHNMVDDFDGEVIIPPGVAMYVVASAASVALFQQSFTWAEVPI